VSSKLAGLYTAWVAWCRYQ